MEEKNPGNQDSLCQGNIFPYLSTRVCLDLTHNSRNRLFRRYVHDQTQMVSLNAMLANLDIRVASKPKTYSGPGRKNLICLSACHANTLLLLHPIWPFQAGRSDCPKSHLVVMLV